MVEVSQHPGAADVWPRPLEPKPVGWLQPPEQAYVGCFPEMMSGGGGCRERRGGVRFRFNSKLMMSGSSLSWELTGALAVGICTWALILCCLDREPCFRFMYLASLLLKRAAAVLSSHSYPISGQACTE